MIFKTRYSHKSIEKKKSDKSNESQGFLKPLIFCSLLPLKQLEYL